MKFGETHVLVTATLEDRLPPWLKGLVPTGHQYPSTLWVEDWRAVGRGQEASAR